MIKKLKLIKFPLFLKYYNVLFNFNTLCFFSLISLNRNKLIEYQNTRQNTFQFQSAYVILQRIHST